MRGREIISRIDPWRRVAELEASLQRAQAAEREQRRRADLAEQSAARAWRLSLHAPRRRDDA